MDLRQLSNAQKTLLKQFREAVKDCDLPETDDVFLLRWLVARDFDLEKAEKMLRNSMDWRHKFQIDSLRDRYQAPEVLTKFFAAGHIGVDKFQSYLLVIRYGMTDVKGILLSAKKKDCVKHVLALVEEFFMAAKRNPSKFKRSADAIFQTVVIIDLEGFSMNHVTYKPALDTAIELIQLYEANYPELLRRVIIINAPKIFSILLSVLVPFMHEQTRNKILVFNHDSAQWRAALLAEIHPEELPVCYGGTMTDPNGNPYCTSKVNMGGIVPKSYYFSSKPGIRNKRPLSISRGAKKLLEYQVNQADTVLKWNFHSEDSDIAFAVYRKQGSELIPIVPHDRVDCDTSPEEGEIDCNDAGVYVVEFDNSFSYLRSKKIWYSITIE